MIDTKNFEILEPEGFENKKDAYDIYELKYSDVKGVTTYFDNGLWYIVKSKCKFLTE